MNMQRRSIRIKALRQAGGIILMACLLAVCTNLLRDNGLQLVGDWSADSRFADNSGESLVIDLTAASRMYTEDKAVFVDARPASQYDQGHIKGAVSLPWQDANERFMEVAPQLEGEKTIICYCDGESCELSHELALFLSDMGFKNVRVLVNGWTKWHSAGLPTKTKGHGDEQDIS
ncbi:MAG: rhodanese-like domain-containing protein [Desulfobacteraceae bacterium]|nr:rhodanese-like domain-containing protein [Desulfobacteraceae bacterium]